MRKRIIWLLIGIFIGLVIGQNFALYCINDHLEKLTNDRAALQSQNAALKERLAQKEGDRPVIIKGWKK